MKPTFYLIDGHSQIFRAYYAPFNVLTAPSGEPVKATYIFTQMLLAILRDRKPDYLAMAMDVSDSTVRRLSLYPEYKANRQETPEDLPPQIDRIEQIVGALGVPIFRREGYEADDVIATIASRLDPERAELRIVSRDKDLYQLITEAVKLWDPVKDELIDAASLEREQGFGPRESVEIQTLTGDAIDNVPGVPGVGPKTAARLIKKYGSADAVISHADELTPKLRENLAAFADKVAVTRKLVTLERDVPMDFDLEACRARPLEPARLRPIFEALSFRRLLEQLDAMPVAAPAAPAGASLGEVTAPAGEAPGAGMAPPGGLDLTTTREGHYALVDTEEAFEAFVAELSRQRCFAVDTETTGLRPVDCDLVGLSFSWREGTGWYIPVRSRRGRTLDPARVAARLKPILEDPAVSKRGQNIKFDRQVLRNEGIDLRGIAFDSMVASYLLEPDRRTHNMDALALEVLGHKTIPITDLIGKGKDQISMLDVDTRRVADYAGEDADITWRLCERFAPRIDASPMRALFRDVELPLVEVLADMEYDGIRLDGDLLRATSAKLRERIEELRRKICQVAGHEFLIDSPKQLAQVLFDELGLPSLKRTKTARSTDAEVLEALCVETVHPLPRLVLEYREIAKLCGTYVEPLPELVSPRTGRLHASFHQTVAATGRLSSSDPNIQNIPVRTAEGREVRKAFVARDGDHVLVTADYSQIELRILAHLSGDEALVDAFRKDQDVHAAVAAQLAGVRLDQVTKDQRSRAKAVNFGIIYGQGAFGLARSLGIGQKEAADFIAAYKRRYPGIVRFMDACVAEAEKTGKVSTLLGRQRPIPEIGSANRSRRALGERLAVNTVVQGTAADMIKVAMVRVHRRIREGSLPASLLIQVHDELVLEAPRSSAAATAEMVRREMEQALPLAVPVKVDTAWGGDWLEAGEGKG
ncbi:MAG: DNA polymerase I [Planctomycetes bacterium]|nr:DNA polymerase I [Planctomycetota bacterium]